MRWIAVIILLNVLNVFGDNWYVATNGLDTNPGSAGEPFLTVQKGFDVAQAGDTIFLTQGTYNEVPITSRSGNDGNYITLDGQGIATVKAVWIAHNYICVKNCTLEGETTADKPELWLFQGASFAIVSNNIINCNSNISVVGIAWEPAADTPYGKAASWCQIISNNISGVCGKPGLSIFGTNNYIYGNFLHDFWAADFINMWGISNRISHNIFSNMMDAAGVGFHPDFIQTFGNNGFGSQDHIIDCNWILDMWVGQATDLEGGLIPEITNWIVFNNIFKHTAWAGSITMPGVKFYNNLFYQCDVVNGGHVVNMSYKEHWAGTNSFWGTNGINWAHGCKMYNNIFLDCGDERDDVGWYYFHTNLIDVAADYNFVAKNSFSAVVEDALHRPIGNPPPDLWHYLCREWWEDNGINGGNPLMTDPDNLNFTVPTNSILIAGTNLYSLFTNDIYGNPRPSSGAWTIGAIEAQEGAGPSSPTGLRVIHANTANINTIKTP